MKERGESNLNCFELGPPYAGMALVLDDRCPARFVNDFMQHPDVRELLDEERLHMLLHARVVLHIGAGEQLLCNYSDGYWQKSGGLEQSVPEEEKKVQDDDDSEEDEPQESDEDEESEEPEEQQERPGKQKSKETLQKGKEREKTKCKEEKKKGKEKKKKGKESPAPEAIVVSESDDDEAERELPSEEAVGSRRKKPPVEETPEPDKQKKRRRLFDVKADDENEDLLSVSQRMTAAMSVSQKPAATLPLWSGSRGKKGHNYICECGCFFFFFSSFF